MFELAQELSDGSRSLGSARLSTSTYERGGWLGTRAGEHLKDWEVTRAETQLMTQLLSDEDETAGSKDVGRDVGNHTRELFISCDPADALIQQFEVLAPEFVAIHDIGTRNARKLISGIATASGRPLQKLNIRRQGFGTTLASIDFIDCEAADGRTVRLYSTDIEADTVTRVSVGRTLMAHSQLTLAMVGDLPPHALSAAFQPLRDAVIRGPWPCRHMLFLPLAAAASLPAQVAEFGQATALEVRTTPQVTRPSDAWSFLCASWNRLQGDMHPDGQGTLLLPLRSPEPAAPTPERAAAASAATIERVASPLNLQPQATKPAPAEEAPVVVADPATRPTGLDLYLSKFATVPGVLATCVFEPARRACVAQTGTGFTAAAQLSQAMTLLAALGSSSRSMGLGASVAELMATLGQHSVLIRALPAFPGLMLHAVIAKPASNLTMARLALQKMDTALAQPKPPGA